MKHSKPLLAIMVSAFALCATVAVIAGFAANQQLISLKEANSQMTKELSDVRKKAYVASKDIAIGDEIVLEGENANVMLTQLYLSTGNKLMIDSETSGYAQTAIPAGSPIFEALVGEKPPVEALTPERVVEEVPESFQIPYTITASHVDVNGKKIAEPTVINLGSGVGEQAFSLYSESPEGYYLSSIKIEKGRVYSFGADRLETSAGKSMVYYYTDKTGLTRTEITEDLEVVFTYKEGSSEQDVDKDVVIKGVLEHGTNSEAVTKLNETSSASGNDAIIFNDISIGTEKDSQKK